MAKYIDVEPIIKGGWQLQRYNSGDGYVNQEHASLKDIPPADVRPVEVGLWLRVGNTGLASCRCGFITDRYSTYRYCPNCGRKNGGVEYGG